MLNPADSTPCVAEVGLGTLEGHFGLLEVGCAEHALVEEVAVAAEGEVGGGMGGLGLGEPGGRGGAVRPGVVEGGLGLAQPAFENVGVDAGQQLAGFDAVPFPDGSSISWPLTSALILTTSG